MESIIFSPDFFIISLVAALWFILPAYIPNPIAVVTGGGRPIDGGRNYRDGKRIFGEGKTWRGFIVGVSAGVLVGVVQILVQNAGGITFLPSHTVLSVFLMATGALLGDLVKSFFKRRIGKDRGEKWPIADQYDLVLGAFLLLAIFDYSWFMANISLPILFWIVVLTPVLHKTANVIGYIAGVKDVPW